MTSALPVHPSFEHLRRQAKDLLRAAQLGQPDAVRRLAAHGPGLPPTPTTAEPTRASPPS